MADTAPVPGAATEETPPKLLDWNQERIRTLHYTWIAFFMTFYVWFNMAPLSTTMLDSEGWLTKHDSAAFLKLSRSATATKYSS